MYPISNNIFAPNAKSNAFGQGGKETRLAFLLAKPTQFDAPFFRWMQLNRPDMPFKVYYWQPVETGADTDSETGRSLMWGINLLEGYHWHQADPGQPDAFAHDLRQYGIKYLVSNGWKRGYAPLLDAARQEGLALGLRIDSLDWDMSPAELWMRRLVLGYAYGKFSRLFSSGSLCDNYLRKIGIPEERISRWPYLVDEHFFSRTQLRLEEGERLRKLYKLDSRPVVLGICKWVKRENPLELLKAFIEVNDTGLQLVLAGDGPLRPELEALRKTVPHLSILFPGYVPYTDLPAWYALSSVFVHPACREVWGVSIHEAIAACCTAIGSSRVGSAYDLILHGHNGFIYPLGDIAALGQSIRQAITISPSRLAEVNAVILQQWSYKVQVQRFAAWVD